MSVATTVSPDIIFEHLFAYQQTHEQVEQEMKLLDIEITGLERKIAQLLDSQRVQPLLQAKGTWLQPILPDANAIIHLRRSEPAQAAAPTL